MGSDDERQDTRTGEDEGLRLKFVRRGTRSSITKYDNQADSILTKKDPTTADENVLIKIASIKSILQGKLRALENIDERLVAKCEISKIENFIEESADVTARVTETLNRINSFTKKAEEAKSQKRVADISNVVATSSPIRPPQGPQAEVLNISSNSRSSNQNSGVRLPKISLPRFNGDITRFYSFWQSFESAIDKNDSLTAIDKFNYLVNVLEGEAFRVVQGLEIVEENYDHAKETLYQRFGHKQKIIQVHMDNLLSLQYSPNDTIAQL